MEQDAVIRELQVELMRVTEQRDRLALQANVMRNIAMTPYGDSAVVIEELMADRDKWFEIATMFYDQHENRRSCSLLASCKRCDAYEKAVRSSGEQTV